MMLQKMCSMALPSWLGVPGPKHKDTFLAAGWLSYADGYLWLPVAAQELLGAGCG
jgi:hypothetical protein